MISKIVLNGSLSKIIFPYTKIYNSIQNETNIKLYVYNKMYNNKNIYTIIELKDVPKYPNIYYIKTSLFADINNKKSYLEENIYHISDHILYQLKVNNEINSKFYYHSQDLKNIQKLNVRDRLSIPVNILLNDINNEIIKSCVDIHI